MAGKTCPACKKEQTKKFASACEFCDHPFIERTVTAPSTPPPQSQSFSPRPTTRPTPEIPLPKSSPPIPPAPSNSRQTSEIDNLSAEERKQIVLSYFDPPKFGGCGCFSVLAGLFFMLVGGWKSWAIAIACFAITGYIISRLKDGVPPHLMDKIVSFYLSNIKEMSLKKTSMDESELIGESVTITGPRLWNTGGSSVCFRKGEDNILRFTPINTTILHLAQHQLVVYQCCLDVVNGTILNEETDEFFYKDIVSVATKAESQTYNTEQFGQIQLKNAETFTLTTSGGTSIKTTLRDPMLIQLMGGGEIPTTEAEKAIQAIRKMLREKKQI